MSDTVKSGIDQSAITFTRNELPRSVRSRLTWFATGRGQRSGQSAVAQLLFLGNHLFAHAAHPLAVRIVEITASGERAMLHVVDPRGVQRFANLLSRKRGRIDAGNLRGKAGFEAVLDALHNNAAGAVGFAAHPNELAHMPAEKIRIAQGGWNFAVNKRDWQAG